MATTQSKERQSVSRQFHRKSRNSCLPCRKRHVRCDLRPPTCSNCHRRNELCSYGYRQNHGLDLALVSSPHYTTETWLFCDDDLSNNYFPLEHTVPNVTPGVPYNLDNPRRIGQVSGININPVNRVMENTFFLSWLPSNLDRALLSRELSRQANSFGYVDQMVTALYALHESRQGMSRSNLAAAYHYQIQASISFRNSQFKVNDTSWLSILMFGIGVIVFQFASALRASDEDSYMELLYVLRNSFSLATELGPYLRTSPLMQFTRPRTSRLTLHLDGLAWDALRRLDSLEYPVGTTDDMRRACVHSTEALKEWVMKIDGYPKNWLHYIGWPAAIPDEFLSMLSRKHPVALVIFVHWCSIMHRSPKRWYMAGWADRAATVAMGYLGEQWNNLLELPRMMLASEPRRGNSPESSLAGADEY